MLWQYLHRFLPCVADFSLSQWSVYAGVCVGVCACVCVGGCVNMRNCILHIFLLVVAALLVFDSFCALLLRYMVLWTPRTLCTYKRLVLNKNLKTQLNRNFLSCIQGYISLPASRILYVFPWSFTPCLMFLVNNLIVGELKWNSWWSSCIKFLAYKHPDKQLTWLSKDSSYLLLLKH